MDFSCFIATLICLGVGAVMAFLIIYYMDRDNHEK